jgi:hypothetical protein
MPQVPVIDVGKHTSYDAAYTDTTFNTDREELVRISGVLEGLQVSKILPANIIQVTAGAWIQNGLIIELTDDFEFPVPLVAFPWTVYGLSDDSVPTSPTTVDVTTTSLVPVGAVPLASSPDGVNWTMVHQLSIKSIRQDLDLLEVESRQRFNLLCNGGFELIQPSKPTTFIFPGPVLDGWRADNLSDLAPASKVLLVTDPTQVQVGGGALELDSESWNDPGGFNPDGSPRTAAVVSDARIWQSIDGYESLLGVDCTFLVSLRLPTGQPAQLGDIEIAFYGSSLGTPGWSDTPVDKVSLVIPSGTLTSVWQTFMVSGQINNLNAGLVAAPLPAFPGISVRVAYVNTEPAGSPIVTDKVLIDSAMFFTGIVPGPVFFPIMRALDWEMAERTYESQTVETVGPGGATDTEYVLAKKTPFRTKKQGIPSLSYQSLVVNEEGSAFTVNNQAAYAKIFVAESTDEFRALVSKLIGGFRPTRMVALVRAQS